MYFIGLDNGVQYHVVAAVQYVSIEQGAFINWLAQLKTAERQAIILDQAMMVW
jgi:hypothetical protein